MGAWLRFGIVCALCTWLPAAWSQALVNVDFGAGAVSGKAGFAATGQSTNDFWNRYRHYEPKFAAGMPLVPDGRLEGLKFADGAPSRVAIAVTNAPGVWGNATGDPMFDSYLFAPNGSNIVVSVTGLDPGRYHFFLYGHADADASAEQNSVFTLRSATNVLGPLSSAGATGWQSGQPWRERGQFVAFRDVEVLADKPVWIDVAPGPGGIAVLNGLQILSRGTAPPRLTRADPTPSSGVLTNILFRSAHFEGRVGDEARFSVTLRVESRTTNEISAPIFEGDLALMNVRLPPACRVVNQGRQFRLFINAPGEHLIELELIARVERAEPWSQVDFRGPAAAIATLTATAVQAGTEVQLLSGTAIESAPGPKEVARGVLGADTRVNMRWQSRTAEVAREAIMAVETKVRSHITPTVIRYTSEFRYEILQSRVARLKLVLPPGHTLTQLKGDLVRDWRIAPEATQSVLTVEMVRPVESATTITLVTEQPLGTLPSGVTVELPQPLGVQRESGSLALAAEDVVAQAGLPTGMRQVNAASGEVASFRFNARPATLPLNLTRIEPFVKASTRVRAVLEEGRLIIRHDLSLSVTKAGIYGIDLTPQPGFIVSDVTGPGVENWKSADGTLRLTFAERVGGDRKLVVQLERALTNTPPEIVLQPLRVAGAARETAMIGAGSSPGLQMKTASLDGVREIPVATLPEHGEELLAFRSDRSDWRITLAAERLATRLVGEVFNLVTIGDGLVGGSATVRYAIVNQGVRQFRVRLPAHWRNVEFTGSNIRRKDRQEDVWTIALQDKAWGAYTLVITYDYAFDPKQATLDAAGAHPLDVERESGSVAITTVAGLTVQPTPVTEPLRQIDPTEIAEGDRALISRPVLLAYRYEGNRFALSLTANRHQETPVLDAVADRAQLTTVLTETGEMLTQAGFMVKNNERQFQRFQLPANATLWGVSVNGEPVKAERDGDWLLVSLPRGANRDQAFAVDIQYAQQAGTLGRLFPRPIELVAPKTDVPGTYAGWELFVPPSRRVSGFDGNMTVARGTTYEVREAWQEFLRVYRGLWHEYGAALIFGGGFSAFLLALALAVKRRGFRGFVNVAAVFAILAILAGMLLPALSKAKSKAQRIKSVNNLKNIGLAAHGFATDHEGRFPANFEEMMGELSTDKTLSDPETGERYTYVGAGRTENEANTVLAFSSEKNGRREVVLGDGSVQVVASAQFSELMAKHELRREEPSKPKMDPTLMSRYGLLPGVRSAPGGIGSIGGGGAPVTASQTVTVLSAIASPQQTPAASAAVPVVTGVRSLKIEIPRSGRAFQFTRVLNLSGEPPTVQFSVMSARAFTALQIFFQLATFILGLVIAWLQWRRSEPQALWLAVGIGLALVGTGSLFIAWRALHIVLIVLAPSLLLMALAWIIWRLFRTPAGADRPSVTPPPIGPASAGALSILILLTLLTQRLPAAETSAAPARQVSVVGASYSGTAREHAVELEATFDFMAAGTNQTVTLFGREVAIREFSAVAGKVELWREGETLGVLLPNRGAAQAKMKLLVKLTGDAGRPRLEFDVPPALGGRLSLLLDEPDAEVEFPTAVSMRRIARDGQTQIEAVLGGAGRVALNWTPRAKRGAEAATIFVQQNSVATFGNGVVNMTSHFNFRATQGELPPLRFALPADQRLLRVTGDLVSSWKPSPTNAGEVIVMPVKTARPGAQIILELESPLETLPATVKVAVPVALDVMRSEGSVAVAATPETGLNVERATGLERISVVKNGQPLPESQARALSAWIHRRPEFDLVVTVSVMQPQLEAVVRNDFVVGAESIALHARADFTITRAGVFSLLLALPPQTRVESVACEPMLSWAERDEAGNRVLDIALKQRVLGPVAVDLRLVRSLTNLPPMLELSGIHTPGTAKSGGFVSIIADAGIGVKTSASPGVTEIPASALPHAAEFGGAGVLAFKQIATESSAAPWRVTLATESLESWVRAEAVSFVTVTETHLSGRSVIRYDIQNAPTREFRLRVPPSWRNVDITGPGLRRRDQTGNEWRVELQNKVRGDFRLNVNWEMPREASTNAIEFTGPETIGTERETGALAFSARPPLQITPTQAGGDLQRIDARELPGWAVERRPASETGTVLNYRYVRPGWKLALEARRFSEAALLQALVDNARLQTVVADDGQLMTQMQLTIRNNGRQHLEIGLPPGATLWSAFVDGRPVRPALRADRLLVPLESAGNAPISVEMTYVGQGRFPRSGGKVELISPQLDVPLKDARWELFLPPDYEYGKFSGSMTWERADIDPIAQDFTLASYRRQEGAKVAQWQKQSVEVLEQSRSELAAGNVKDAGSRLNFFRSQAIQANDAPVAAEFKKLEDEIVRNQGSNLLQEQQRIASDNGMLFGGRSVAMDSVADRKRNFGDLDAKVAERQVEQLQKAQAVAVAQIAPLHVNLPTRGLRHSFTQVLQTEAGKPLSIGFRATNDRDSGWLRRLTIWAGGFAALWMLAGISLLFRPTREA